MPPLPVANLYGNVPSRYSATHFLWMMLRTNKVRSLIRPPFPGSKSTG